MIQIDVPKPEHCYDCPICYDGYYCPIAMRHLDFATCDIQRMDFCPLEEVTDTNAGKWIITGGMKTPEYHHHHQCSICESYAPMSPPYGAREMLTPHCPVCNAKMDLEEHNER